MGYLTTAIAAAAINASNLQPVKELPDISGLDLFIPRCVDRMIAVPPEKVKEQNIASQKVNPITYYTVKKDRHGNKQIVAHRSKPDNDKGGELDKPDEKKEKSENGEKKDEKLTDKKEDIKDKKEDEKKANANLTTEEDAMLKELKAMHMSNKDIAREMKRTVKQIKARCHELKITGEEAGKGEKKNKEDGNGKENGKKVKVFTAEDDIKLEDMVVEGALWSEIARELKCNVEQLKARLKEISPKAADKAEKKEHHDQDRKKKNKNKNDAKHDQASNTDRSYPSSKPISSASSDNGQIRFTMDEWMALQADGLFNFAELGLLMDLLMRDEYQSWTYVASRFFDVTGRRVHPEDIREKFEQMASMGGRAGLGSRL